LYRPEDAARYPESATAVQHPVQQGTPEECVNHSETPTAHESTALQSEPEPQSTLFQWMQKTGIHIGAASRRGTTFSLFLANPFDRHADIRMGLEYSNYIIDKTHRDQSGVISAGISHVGAVADYIYYFGNSRPFSNNFYLAAGLGVHWTRLKDAYDRNLNESRINPTYAWGIGWTGKDFNIEIKRTYSILDSDDFRYESKGWVQLVLGYRFSFFGQPKKVDTTDLLILETTKNDDGYSDAPTISEVSAPQSLLPQSPKTQSSWSPWKPKVGIRIGATSGGNSGTFSLFLENQVNNNWALRPGLDFIVYRETEKSYDVAKVYHIGIPVDFIYYLRGHRNIARGIYLLAGTGVYYAKLDGLHEPYWSESHPLVAVDSWGFGWSGEKFGFEIKKSYSSLVAFTYRFADIRGNWLQFGVSYRFNLPG
jgi:hypothetical protein